MSKVIVRERNGQCCASELLRVPHWRDTTYPTGSKIFDYLAGLDLARAVDCDSRGSEKVGSSRNLNARHLVKACVAGETIPIPFWLKHRGASRYKPIEGIAYPLNRVVIAKLGHDLVDRACAVNAAHDGYGKLSLKQVDPPLRCEKSAFAFDEAKVEVVPQTHGR